MADVLTDRGSLTQALATVGRSRRAHASELLRRAGLGSSAREATVSVLRAVEGARSHPTSVSPVWTAPGDLAKGGALTASVHHLVASARESVTCSTYNFQKSSALWSALCDAAAKEHLHVRIYIDTAAADEHPAAWKPTTSQIAQSMKGAHVMRTKTVADQLVRSHAKFVAVDHRFIIVTSANFSMSAEQRNVELGIRIDDPSIVEAIERDMGALESSCYERVRTPGDVVAGAVGAGSRP